MDNISCCDLNNKERLREVTVKIRLERVDIQKGVTVEALLDSRAIGLVMSSEFARKQEFKLKKNRKTYIYKKCEWNVQQGGANKTHSGSQYVVATTRHKVQ